MKINSLVHFAFMYLQKWLSKLGLISYQPKTQMYTSNHSVKNIRVLAPLTPRGLARTHVACSYKAIQTGWAKSNDLDRERSWHFSPLILCSLPPVLLQNGMRMLRFYWLNELYDFCSATITVLEVSCFSCCLIILLSVIKWPL